MKTIVLVDDDKSHLAMLTFIIFSFCDDATLFVTLDAIRAKNFVMNNQVDLLITDYMLDSTIDGKGLCDVAKKQNTKCLIITALQPSKLPPDITPDMYIEKPINREKFILKIKNFLEIN